MQNCSSAYCGSCCCFYCYCFVIVVAVRDSQEHMGGAIHNYLGVPDDMSAPMCGLYASITKIWPSDVLCGCVIEAAFKACVEVTGRCFRFSIGWKNVLAIPFLASNFSRYATTVFPANSNLRTTPLGTSVELHK